MRIIEPITTEIEITDYETIQHALLNQHLSRTFDKRSYEDGNVRMGIVSTMHGRPHRNRRRLENAQFRPAALELYEQELFPPVMERFVSDGAAAGEADLFVLGEKLSIVLAAKRAGFDFDDTASVVHHQLIDYVDEFSQASALVDAADPDAIRIAVKKAFADFAEQFGAPSIARRRAALDAVSRGEMDAADLPQDILMALVEHATDADLALEDDFMIVREAAVYLQGGTHTSSQTLINAVDLLLASRDTNPEFWDRTKEDLAFAQRVMHETLRLRPTTPKAKRRAEEDTEVDGISIPEGALVVLDFHSANRDTALFGEDAAVFNPDRELAVRTPRWGLTFGGGPHICPGRKVAGGLPQNDVTGDLDDNHLHGLVAMMIQAVVRREPKLHASKPQSRDDRTERFTRWADYWVTFENPH